MATTFSRLIRAPAAARTAADPVGRPGSPCWDCDSASGAPESRHLAARATVIWDWTVRARSQSSPMPSVPWSTSPRCRLAISRSSTVSSSTTLPSMATCSSSRPDQSRGTRCTSWPIRWGSAIETSRRSVSAVCRPWSSTTTQRRSSRPRRRSRRTRWLRTSTPSSPSQAPPAARKVKGSQFGTFTRLSTSTMRSPASLCSRL